MKSRLFIALFAVLCGLVAAFARFPRFFPASEVITQRIRGKATVSDRIAEFGPRVDARWQPFFERAGVAYPPQKLVFLGLKVEKRMEIYAQNAAGEWKFVRTLPILAASGKAGPKLREGDLQVPEGFYRVESLNPNSAYHLALRVSYPSPADREIAAREGRENLGGAIMIHGSNASIGCLAMGDEAAEDLFVLAEKSGRENVEIVLCPLDFRVEKLPRDPNRSAWVKKRYAELARFVQTLPRVSP